MSESEERYDELADELVFTEQVTPGKAFGMPCLSANGYMFAGLSRGELVVKLPGDALQKALALAGAHNFDPSGQNMPMREWVQVPAQHAGVWNELARAALAYARSLPPKAKRGNRRGRGLKEG
ncbi:MAG: TfoX/Sxy family protein [Ardenticatenaceae bacterium]